MNAVLTAKGLSAGHADRVIFSGADLVVSPAKVIGLPIDHDRLDHPNFFDGSRDAPVFYGLFHDVRHLLDRKKGCKRQDRQIGLERDFDLLCCHIEAAA